jgi:geranylgeranyl diphosphate synthase, type II
MSTRPRKTRGKVSRSEVKRPPRTWEAWVEAVGPAIDRELKAVLPRAESPARLRSAMRYSLFPGGKRLRPALAILGHAACGGRDPEIARMAASLELVHTFSLIHDDLPCMDDDDFRRGRPTCHRVHGEALAVLAGDALLNLAYEVLANLRCDTARRVAIITRLAAATGANGVLGGQVDDIAAEGVRIREGALRSIHARKTAALMAAALGMGGDLAGASASRLADLDAYGSELGLLFQLVDDILNVEGSPEELGRPAGGDARHQKATYPSIVGLDKAHARMRRRAAAARARATAFGPWSELFADLVRVVVDRVPGHRS